MQDTDDLTLLRQYVEDQAEAAFATLVVRHVNLVHSVALRLVDCPHQAEEVTQVVFFILARKAAALRHLRVLSSWLFQTTRLTAANFRRRDIRRARREQEAHVQSLLNDSGSDVWTQVAPLLDTAVASLNEREREVIVLRFYERLNLRSVGAALGISEDAAYQRVDRAVEKLRQFFVKRGFVLSAAVLSAAISGQCVQAAPVGLAAAASAAAQGSVALAASTTSVVQATLEAMRWATIKSVLTAGASVLLIGGIIAVVLSARDHPAASGASFQGLGDLPGGDFFSAAYAVSANGQIVVGTSKSANGTEAFRWSATLGMTGLGALPGDRFYSDAFGVSADGMVVAGSSRSASRLAAYRWTQATGMVPLGNLPGGDFSSAWGISGNGQVIVGFGSSFPSGQRYQAFRWTAAEGLTGLGDLSGGNYASRAWAVSADGAVIVGESAAPVGYEAFRWTAATGMVGLGDFPGGWTNSNAYGVSSDGSIVVGNGYSGAFDPYTHEAFRWTAQSGLVRLGFAPGDQNSVARAVTADGNTIVGDDKFSRDSGYAFLWTPQAGMRRLREVLIRVYGLNLNGWQLTSARAITPDGNTVVGTGINPSGRTEAWLATGLRKNPPPK